MTGTPSTTPSPPTAAALLAADRKRLNKTSAIGLDETSFLKPRRVQPHQLRHHGRRRGEPPDHRHPSEQQLRRRGRLDRPTAEGWKERIRFGALDMSATYAAVYSVILPKAAQVVDPFHLIALANRCLDAVRRRVQTEQTGHRGRQDDPLYRARRVLLMGEEKLDDEATARLASLLELGDPNAEVAIAYRIKERLRTSIGPAIPTRPGGMLEELQDHCLKRAMPPEVRRLGRTIRDVVRQDLQLPPGKDDQRADRGAQQPDQTDQADRLRLPQLRELPDPGPALRRQAELAGPRLDRCPMRPDPARIRRATQPRDTSSLRLVRARRPPERRDRRYFRNHIGRDLEVLLFLSVLKLDLRHRSGRDQERAPPLTGRSWRAKR